MLALDTSAGGRSRYRRAAGNQPCDACGRRLHAEAGVDVHVWHVQLIGTGTKGRIFGGMPAGVQAHTLAAACCFSHPKRVMVDAVADPREFGYAKLYALLLGDCQKQLAAALRVFTHPGNFPLLVNCVQGKDRTGLIAMLVLMLCGVPHVVIMEDFVQSQENLEADLRYFRAGGQEGDGSLVKTPIGADAASILDTVNHLNATWGSAEKYCQVRLGLSDAELTSIRTNLMKKP
eukprot:jgi/Astpho2/1079/Aster-07459